jgi:hypothetical protein
MVSTNLAPSAETYFRVSLSTKWVLVQTLKHFAFMIAGEALHSRCHVSTWRPPPRDIYLLASRLVQGRLIARLALRRGESEFLEPPNPSHTGAS